MRNGPILVLVGSVVAVLALVVYSANRGTAPADAPDAASSARELRATAVSSGRLRSGAGSVEGQPGTTSRAPRAGERPSSGFGAPSRPRLPEASEGGGGAGGADVAEERGTIDGDAVAASPPLGGRELPAPGSGSRAGAAPGAESDTMPELRPNVVYEGGDRVFDTTSRQQITDRRQIEGNAGSISFWAQPQWDAGNEDRASFVQIGENGLRVVKDGNFLRFEYTNSAGDNEVGGIADISNWQQGQWRHVAATWEGGTLVLYVDGQRMRMTAPYEPPPAQNDPRLYVGSSGGLPSAPAQLSRLEVANRPLTLVEIQKQFRHGPPR